MSFELKSHCLQLKSLDLGLRRLSKLQDLPLFSRLTDLEELVISPSR
jgi:hypothetical protein